MKRRRLLATASAIVGGVPTVGCLGDGGSGDEVDPVDRGDIAVEYETTDYAQPSWLEDMTDDDEPRAVHATAAVGAGAFEVEDLRDDEFLLYVQSWAPNTCYELQFERLDMTPNRVLTGVAQARDTSTEREGCATMMTTPSRLARVRTEPALPTHADLEVIDGLGDSYQIRSVEAP